MWFSMTGDYEDIWETVSKRMMSSERLRRLRCGFICVVLSSLLPLLSLYYSKEDNKTIIEPKQRPNWNPRNISCDVKKNVGKRKSVWNVTKAVRISLKGNATLKSIVL